MARKTKEDAEKTRTLILASALALFSKNGYERTTFTDIAARLKMTKGAVYWHFPNKEALLVSLIRMALMRFKHQLDAAMPSREFTFSEISEIMVHNAVDVCAQPRAVAFFRLMKCQLNWTDASMAEVRRELLDSTLFGPRQAFVEAVKHDQRDGLVRKDVDSEGIAASCIALWDGLVQAHIDHFLDTDLEKTLRDVYKAVWNGIKN